MQQSHRDTVGAPANPGSALLVSPDAPAPIEDAQLVKDGRRKPIRAEVRQAFPDRHSMLPLGGHRRIILRLGAGSVTDPNYRDCKRVELLLYRGFPPGEVAASQWADIRELIPMRGGHKRLTVVELALK